MGRGLDMKDDIVVPRLDTSKLGLGALIEECVGKNSVTVAVYRAQHGRMKETLKEQVPVVGYAPALALQDIARMLAGLKPMWLDKAMRSYGGELVGAFPNLRTNVGIDYAAAQLSGTTVLVADTIALSSSTRSPTATDAETTLPWSTSQTSDTAPVTNPNASSGEITFGGLQRAASTYAHTVGGPASGNASYTLSHTWTASTTITSVQMAGLFGGSAKATGVSGTNATNMLFLESTFTATLLNNGDQLALTWTVNI